MAPRSLVLAAGLLAVFAVGPAGAGTVNKQYVAASVAGLRVSPTSLGGDTNIGGVVFSASSSDRAINVRLADAIGPAGARAYGEICQDLNGDGTCGGTGEPFKAFVVNGSGFAARAGKDVQVLVYSIADPAAFAGCSPCVGTTGTVTISW